MKKQKFIFSTRESIDEIVDDYIGFDTDVQMRMRNGMTRELYVKAAILNYFMIDNDLADLAKHNDRFEVIPESISEVALICSKHYKIPKDELVQAFVRYCGLEFYDRNRRELFEQRLRELNKRK